jgi:hypothetical protein
MNKFISIVERHKRLQEIGSLIVKHHAKINKCSPSTIAQYQDQEKQINLIKDFISESKELEDEWKSNSRSIYKYWTGLSK